MAAPSFGNEILQSCGREPRDEPGSVPYERTDSGYSTFSRPESWKCAREPDHRLTALVGGHVVALEPKLVENP